MQKYANDTIGKVRELRSFGKTYGEIREFLRKTIPKSTLSEWCKKVKLPKNYAQRIYRLNVKNLSKGRSVAVEINKIKREEFFNKIRELNIPIAEKIKDKETAKIALAMLCLGEASKYNNNTRTAFCLGNSDPRIITLFIELLKICYDFDVSKVRCTVQCRADQNIVALQKFWLNVTQIPKHLFYKTQIDPRTIGKPTLKRDYKGVLRVNYFDTNVQHDLESLSDLMYKKIRHSQK